MFDAPGPAAILHRAKLVDERAHSASSADAVPRNSDHNAHLQDKLKQIGPQHAPQAAERNVDSGKWNQEEDAQSQRSPLVDAEDDGGDRCHGFCNPAKDHAIHEQTEVECAKSAEEGGGLSGVANFGEFDVGQKAGANPQPREKKNRHHARGQHAPPDPIARDAVAINVTR